MRQAPDHRFSQEMETGSMLHLKIFWHGTVDSMVTVKGKNAIQKKWSEDNIKELTGIDFASPTRATEDRTRWNGIGSAYRLARLGIYYTRSNINVSIYYSTRVPYVLVDIWETMDMMQQPA